MLFRSTGISLQHFLESVHYDLVNSLGLSISLRISWNGIPICDTKITTVSPKGFANKLKPVVRDESTRDLELGDDVFPEKLFGINVFDIRQGFSFYPFGEIVRAD